MVLTCKHDFEELPLLGAGGCLEGFWLTWEWLHSPLSYQSQGNVKGAQSKSFKKIRIIQARWSHLFLKEPIELIVLKVVNNSDKYVIACNAVFLACL